MTVADCTADAKDYTLTISNQLTNIAADRAVTQYLDATISVRAPLYRSGMRADAYGWLLASQSALAKGWDNPLDAQYDAL